MVEQENLPKARIRTRVPAQQTIQAVNTPPGILTRLGADFGEGLAGRIIQSRICVGSDPQRKRAVYHVWNANGDGTFTKVEGNLTHEEADATKPDPYKLWPSEGTKPAPVVRTRRQKVTP